ncbi:hypothetical protein M407DRAFT_33285 [Tulasnella calospora MUT 4182]|uniref:Uncharacterized protein n=1 Tax=Tulasnella calospora MUT 4182 TaxID=1051891 RepID=A0A0C3L685_9AGAM|nr:hypothetical protein M407DRAFT_33285 [Tulasnella calospora MUT 4182]
MNEPAMNSGHLPLQGADLVKVMKAVMTNAIILRVRESALEENGNSTPDTLRDSVAQLLADESHALSIFPITTSGRFNTLNRYLLAWCSISDSCCSFLRDDVSSRAAATITHATAEDRFGDSARETRE